MCLRRLTPSYPAHSFGSAEMVSCPAFSLDSCRPGLEDKAHRSLQRCERQKETCRLRNPNPNPQARSEEVRSERKKRDVTDKLLSHHQHTLLAGDVEDNEWMDGRGKKRETTRVSSNHSFWELRRCGRTVWVRFVPALLHGMRTSHAMDARDGCSTFCKTLASFDW